MPCCPLAISATCIRTRFGDYDGIQYAAVILLYVQIACALVGSLGAWYNGVMLSDLAVALFALVAIENSSQALGRMYAALLAASILLDIIWFILFSHTIWNISAKNHGHQFAFSVKLTLWMQIFGFCSRLVSSILWIQMYRLGASGLENKDIRASFLDPTLDQTGQRNCCGGAIGNTEYDIEHCNPFEDAEDQR